MLIGLVLFASAFLQGTALILTAFGLEFKEASMVNVYSGWFGLGIVAAVIIFSIIRAVRRRQEQV